MNKPIRFTVYSSDAIITKSGTQKRPRLFQWKLDIPCGNKRYDKIAIESVFCRNYLANITNNKAGSILELELIKSGPITFDISESMILKTESISGVGAGVTFMTNGYNSQLRLRDKGLNYEIGDEFFILNEDESAPIEQNKTIYKVKKVTLANSTTHDLISIPDILEVSNANTQRMISLGNSDEKELYSIRCRYISNSYDTRDSSHNNGGKILYSGPLNYQNDNPNLTFAHDLNSYDFLNGEFEISVDSNYLNEKGISHDLTFAITFLIMSS